MRTFVRGCLIVALAGAIASPLSAQEKKRKKGAKRASAENRAVAAAFALPKSVQLSDEQKKQVAALKKEFGPKLEQLVKKQSAKLTDEQKRAQKNALKAAKEAGKRGKELRQAAADAANLTAAQQAESKSAQKEIGKLRKEIRDRLMALLTDEQKSQIKTRGKNAKRKKGKKRQDA